jgi:hypothetical protein
MYQMAHVFLSLDQIGQAQQVAATTAASLEPLTRCIIAIGKRTIRRTRWLNRL